MAYCLITCPESAHLELIEFEETPLGMLITGCSRFREACASECPRTCAARLDRRAALSTPADDDILGVGDTTNVDVLGLLRA